MSKQQTQLLDENGTTIAAANSPDDTYFKDTPETVAAGPAKLNTQSSDDEEDMDRAHHALTLLLIYKERMERVNICIGGVSCHVKAVYLNGRVVGEVSPAISNKKYEFEFEPLKSLHKKLLIIAEVKRLYWDYFPPGGLKKAKNGRQGLVLCHLSEDQCDPFNYNFLDKELYYLA